MISFTFICKKIIHIFFLNKSQPLNNPCQQMSRKILFQLSIRTSFPNVDILSIFMRNGIYDCNLLVIKSPKPPKCPWDITISDIECILSSETSLYRFRDENLNNFPDIKPLMK